MKSTASEGNESLRCRTQREEGEEQRNGREMEIEASSKLEFRFQMELILKEFWRQSVGSSDEDEVHEICFHLRIWKIERGNEIGCFFMSAT